MVGQLLLPALLLKQRMADLFLEPLHLLHDGGLRLVQMHGGRGKAVQIGDGDQCAQKLEFKHFFHI
jgi:hypothetical protein